MTFWETIERGEYVMFALLVIFIAIIVIWWVRGAGLRREWKGYSPLMHRVRDYVTEGDLDNARQTCESWSTPGSRVVNEGILRIGKPMSEVRAAMMQSAECEKEKMERGVVWLRAFAVISPLLGLGGTLVGVIDRLRDLAESSQPVDTGTLCGGIAPTIVTTVAGLGVGIFALIALTALNSTILGAKRRLDETAREFTDLLEQPAS